MDDCVPLERASRDFRVKFPDDVLQESLSGQLWFGAEVMVALFDTQLIISFFSFCFCGVDDQV